MVAVRRGGAAALHRAGRWPAAAGWRGDVLIPAVLLLVGLGVLLAVPAGDDAHRSGDLLAGALITAMTVVLVFRRRWPVAVLVVTIAVIAVYQLLDYPIGPVLPLAPVALYTVAVTGERRRSLIVGAATCALVAVVLAVTEPGSTYFSDLVGALGWVVVALALGEAVRYHRAYTAEAEDRVARIEASREAELRQRVTDERIRVARDVHDVLAHSIAAISVQAGVAAHLIEQNRGPDAQALATIGGILNSIAETSRGGVADLQATLDLLRGEAARLSDPVPGLHGLATLVTPVRASGTHVRVAVVGDRRPLPHAHDVAAFRIIQEALTNAVKHGRPARIVITLEYHPAEVRVVVSDDGASSGVTELNPAERGGYGIVGMTERAHSVGGSLAAGPSPDGGFVVEAVLPVPWPSPPTPVPAREAR